MYVNEIAVKYEQEHKEEVLERIAASQPASILEFSMLEQWLIVRYDHDDEQVLEELQKTNHVIYCERIKQIRKWDEEE